MKHQSPTRNGPLSSVVIFSSPGRRMRLCWCAWITSVTTALDGCLLQAGLARDHYRLSRHSPGAAAAPVSSQLDMRDGFGESWGSHLDVAIWLIPGYPLQRS